jgi:hypothetical protein
MSLGQSSLQFPCTISFLVVRDEISEDLSQVKRHHSRLSETQMSSLSPHSYPFLLTCIEALPTKNIKVSQDSLSFHENDLSFLPDCYTSKKFNVIAHQIDRDRFLSALKTVGIM